MSGLGRNFRVSFARFPKADFGCDAENGKLGSDRTLAAFCAKVGFAGFHDLGSAQ
ncbi:MAG: hypothetical protein ABJM90_05595 [Paracoccaceae bacterium]